MPTTQLHQDKQSRTELARSELEQSQNSLQHADWIVTLAFYRALHAVDSYFAKLGIHPKGHRGRSQYVQNYLESINERYLALYRASITARYEGDTYRDDSQAVTTLVNDSLVIEEHINTLLEAH
jgi:hypothetical protein